MSTYTFDVNIDKYYSRAMDRTVAGAYCTQCQSNCHEWAGCHNQGGYARIGVVCDDGKYRMITVTRLVWQKHYGLIPAGLFVLHKCDNPGCVNIEHLELGNASKNNTDAHQRGRRSASHRKHTDKDVADARYLYNFRGWSTYKLARALNTSDQVIGEWVRNKRRIEAGIFDPLAELQQEGAK